jgi:predicted nucleic acid-binding protein
MEKLKQNRDNGLCISSITLAEMEYGIENANHEYKAKNAARASALTAMLSEFSRTHILVKEVG